MCGLAGIIQKNSDVRAGEIRSMLEVIKYRGPDQSGIHTHKNVGIGSVRLSIVGLGNGKMPISNKSMDKWIVYNGETYNYKYLKEDLVRAGSQFFTDSDTEVVLRLYEQIGTSCFEKLNGMFAVCILDETNDRLILARDQMGQKPIYYANTGDRFLFSSEIKSILEVEPELRNVSKLGLTSYLTLGYTTSDITMFDGIHRLKPGHFLIYDLKKNTINVEKFWSVPFSQEENISYEECKRELRERFIQAVDSRMIADVPISIFLSGGIDSTAVGAVVSKILGHKLNSYSFGYSEKFGGTADRFNVDAHYSELSAKAFGFKHQYLSIDRPDLPQLLEKIVWHQDEPNYVPSLVPIYLLSEKIGQNFKVALSGDGADELFGGYEMYRIENYLSKLNIIPSELRKRVLKSTRLFFPEEHSVSKISKRVSQVDFIDRYLSWRSIVDSELMPKLTEGIGASDQELFRDILRSDFGFSGSAKNFGQLIAKADIKWWVSDHQTLCSDKMSMASSLEVRSPFLDHRLVEFSQKIPFKYKIKSGQTKWIFKDTFSDILPTEVINRKKSGILAPSSTWIREQLYPLFNNLLSKESIERAGLLNYEIVRKIFDDHVNKRKYSMIEVWSLANLQLWHEIFIQQRRHPQK